MENDLNANTRIRGVLAGRVGNPANERDRSHLEGEVKRVAPPAVRLLSAVARLLPAAYRARYEEEFRAELWDLAQAGAGRLWQVAYALRQLRCARLTVSALRSPRCHDDRSNGGARRRDLPRRPGRRDHRWLLGSDARAARVSQVLLAWRGKPGLPADSPAAPAIPSPPPRLWPWLRRP